MTESDKFRNQGNDIYKSSLQLGTSLALFRVEKAIACYNQALSAARLARESASACKNLFVACRRAFILNALQEYDYKLKYYGVQALENCTKAVAFGTKSSNSSTWLNELIAKGIMFAKRFSSSTSFEESTKFQDRLHWICFQRQYQLLPELKALLCLELGNCYLKSTIRLIESKQFIKAKHQIAEISRPLIEAQSHFNSKKIIFNASEINEELQENNDIFYFTNHVSELNILAEDLKFTECVVGASSSIAIGDSLLQVAISNDESINMEMVYDAMDSFSQAIVNAKELDVEQEAIACSRLGDIFTTVFKMTVKGKDYFTRAIRLGLSLAPRVMDNEPWFAKARAGVLKFQNAMNERDREELEKKRKPFLDELKDELVVIANASKASATNLLDIVYEKHPPKREDHRRKTHTEQEVEENGVKTTKKTEITLKNQLRKALVHYHPDRISDTDMKWKVLCEEICKLLTFHYERLK